MASSRQKINYDDKADVLYVTFGTNEPSYCEPLSNFLLLELGIFTNQPTGFRVIQPRKRNIRKIAVRVEKVIYSRMRTMEKELHYREEVVKTTMNQIKQVGEVKELAGIT